MAITKLVINKAARQQVESGESYAPILGVSFGFQLVTRLLLYVCDMFGLAWVHGGFHRFLDCFGAVNMTVICLGVVIRWLLDVSRLTNPKDLQVILRYQKKLVRAGVLSLALILYLQLILAIGEEESGCWVAFAFIAGASFAVCVTSMLCYHFLIDKQLTRFCKEVLKTEKIKTSFRRMHIAVVVTMILQGTVAALTAALGGPTFSWLFNSYGAPPQLKFVVHCLYNEIVDFLVVMVYLFQYQPAITDNLVKVAVEKDSVLHTLLARKREQLAQDSARTSVVKARAFTPFQHDSAVDGPEAIHIEGQGGNLDFEIKFRPTAEDEYDNQQQYQYADGNEYDYNLNESYAYYNQNQDGYYQDQSAQPSADN